MSTSSRQSQVSLLQSQAKPVFTREAFKSAVWVGVVYASSNGVGPKRASLNIVIVYNPKYSENKVWELYFCEEKDMWEDPDQPKLERAWDRKVKILRIFEGSSHYWKDVEALFYAETLHGDFNCRVLRNLRSIYYEKAEEYQTMLNKSFELVTNLMAARKESMSSPEASQQAYEIAKILETGTMDIVRTPWRLAEILGRIGSDCPSWPETLEALWRALLGSQAPVELLLSRVTKKMRKR